MFPRDILTTRGEELEEEEEEEEEGEGWRRESCVNYIGGLNIPSVMSGRI